MNAMRMRQLAPTGGPAASNAVGKLVVMTYNVLAQCYVKSSFFPYCKPAALRWKNRSRKLVRSMSVGELLCGAAFTHKVPFVSRLGRGVPVAACAARCDLPAVAKTLQEVDQYAEFWAGMMQKIGYSGLYKQKTLQKKDGVVIFWKPDRFQLVQHQELELDNPVGDESDCNEDLLSRSRRGSVGLITHFKQVADDDTGDHVPPLEFVLATTHLFWDPAQEDVKLLQTRRVLRPLQDFARSLGLPTIFAGDFNSLPDSKVYNFITKDHHFASAYSRYACSTETGASAGEPKFTNVNGAVDSPHSSGGAPQMPQFSGTLDYLFYQLSSTSSMSTAALMEIMSFEDATKEISLPNSFSPSDHLPLIAEFRIHRPH